MPSNLSGHVKIQAFKTLKGVKDTSISRMSDYKMVKNHPAVHGRFVARNYCDRM